MSTHTALRAGYENLTVQLCTLLLASWKTRDHSASVILLGSLNDEALSVHNAEALQSNVSDNVF